MESNGSQDYQPRTVGNLFFVDSSMEYICHLSCPQHEEFFIFHFISLEVFRYVDAATSENLLEVWSQVETAIACIFNL